MSETDPRHARDQQLRTCNTCGAVKPLAAYDFKDCFDRGVPYRMRRCRTCEARRKREYEHGRERDRRAGTAAARIRKRLWESSELGRLCKRRADYRARIKKNLAVVAELTLRIEHLKGI